ncbi:E3 ubiquitin-protein ligase TRIM11-like [Dromiciops gliroides]|uniref:E3 ubiquitin-protein ligase TRIM11-like n=1 Tax=Dromiciops gliroides TaxID=33562 RepID=UPI001CC74915|nr:E3 ubiquitin-protein ligase TRIM11-like [Dromiciops gliroides]
MASLSKLIQDLQEELICSICREYFTDPITIECGHSYCQSCLIISCQEASTPFSCPECKSVSQLRDFQINVHLGQLATIAQKLRPHCVQYPEGNDKCEIHQKVKNLFCEDDHSPICVLCSQSQEHEAHRFYSISEAAANLREKLQGSVIHLQKKNKKVMRQMTYERLKFKQMKDMKRVLTRNDSLLQKEIEFFHVNMKIYPIPGIIKRIFCFKEYVTLDCNTADPGLIISQDLKSVRYGGAQEEVPNNSGRFLDFAQVLATQSFISRRCYWEVEVPNNTAWCVGICKNSKDLQDFFMLMTEQKNDCYYIYAIAQHNLYPQIHVRYRQMTVPNLKVGIFLDYECGEISFYHVEKRYLIYTFPPISFSGLLTPFFCLSKKVLESDGSLTICS